MHVAPHVDTLTSDAWLCILSIDFFDHAVAVLPHLMGILAVCSSYWGSVPLLGTSWEQMGRCQQCTALPTVVIILNIPSLSRVCWVPVLLPLIHWSLPRSPPLRADTHRLCDKSAEHDPTQPAMSEPNHRAAGTGNAISSGFSKGTALRQTPVRFIRLGSKSQKQGINYNLKKEKSASPQQSDNWPFSYSR